MAVIAITCLSCAARPRILEKDDILKSESVTLKHGGHANVKFEKAIRSYWTKEGWFQVAGGEPSREIKHFYYVVTGTIQATSGRAITFGWISPYRDLSYYYVKPGRLVFVDKDIFIEYTLVPTFESGRYLPIERTPFNGNPRLLVKYAKYAGTRRYKPAGGGIDFAFSSTYKWPVEYVWEEMRKSEFENAAKSGDVVSLDFNNRNNDVRFDYYDYYAKRAEPDTERTRFLHAVKSADAAKVEQMVNRNPALIQVYDHDGKTALHLALESQYRRHLLPLLYRFNPPINAVDFKGQTPLHTAARYSAGEEIKQDLIDKGGMIKFGRLRGQYGLAANVFCTDLESKGWRGNDAYEVLVECPVKTGSHCNQAAVLPEGKERIVHELGLSGAPDSLTSRIIGWILDNIEPDSVSYQERADRSSVERSLIRTYGPNLRGLVKEYNESAGRTGPGGAYPDFYSGYCKRCNRNREQIEFLEAAKNGDNRKVERMLDRNPDLVHAHDDEGKTALHLAPGHNDRLYIILPEFRDVINVIDYKGHTPLHVAAELRDMNTETTDRLIGMGGQVLYPDCSFRKLLPRIGKSIPDKVIRDIKKVNGWVSDDVYQVWEECVQDCSEEVIRTRARERFISELGLRGAPEESKIQCTIEKILLNMAISCYEKGKPKSRRLVRICAQGLKGLVREYHEQKGRPGS
jgi:ankyrin repeat protein